MSALPSIEMAVMGACEAIVKTCGCGAAYDSDTWAALPLCGYVGAASEDDSQVLELKNCQCGSTLALEVPRPERMAA